MNLRARAAEVNILGIDGADGKPVSELILLSLPLVAGFFICLLCEREMPNPTKSKSPKPPARTKPQSRSPRDFRVSGLVARDDRSATRAAFPKFAQGADPPLA